MSSFNYWKVSWTWVIAEELRKGAKRSQTNRRSCLSLSRAQRHFTVRILLQYRSYLLFAVSQYRLFWVINVIYCTPKCFVGRELKPCYCNHLNPHADRNIHPDPVTIRVPYRLYWAFSFQCNLFSETEMITRCVKTYQVLKYLSLLVTKQHNITQKNTMIYFWCLMTDFTFDVWWLILQWSDVLCVNATVGYCISPIS